MNARLYWVAMLPRTKKTPPAKRDPPAIAKYFHQLCNVGIYPSFSRVANPLLRLHGSKRQTGLDSLLHRASQIGSALIDSQKDWKDAQSGQPIALKACFIRWSGTCYCKAY